MIFHDYPIIDFVIYIFDLPTCFKAKFSDIFKSSQVAVPLFCCCCWTPVVFCPNWCASSWYFLFYIQTGFNKYNHLTTQNNVWQRDGKQEIICAHFHSHSASLPFFPSVPLLGAEVRSRPHSVSAPSESKGSLGHWWNFPLTSWTVWVRVSLPAPSLRRAHLELLDELSFLSILQWTSYNNSTADKHATKKKVTIDL